MVCFISNIYRLNYGIVTSSANQTIFIFIDLAVYKHGKLCFYYGCAYYVGQLNACVPTYIRRTTKTRRLRKNIEICIFLKRITSLTNFRFQCSSTITQNFRCNFIII